MEAAEAALQPAWAALQAGEHKVPPTPPRPPQAARRPAPSPRATTQSCSARAKPPSGEGSDEGFTRRDRQAGGCADADCVMAAAHAGATSAACSAGCAHTGCPAAKAVAPSCRSRGGARPVPGSSALSPFSPSPPAGLEAPACGAVCQGGPASAQRSGLGSSGPCGSPSEGFTRRDGGDGFRTPPRLRGHRASGQQCSPTRAEPCAATQREGAQAAETAETVATDTGGSGFHTPLRSHGRRSWRQQGSPDGAEPSTAMRGGGPQASAGPESLEAAAASSATAQDEWPAAPFLRRFSAPWVHVSMATAGVSLREKQRRYAEAADLLRLLLGAGLLVCDGVWKQERGC